jgi:hypothetical protein
MKGFLFLGAAAFLGGAAVAVVMDRRSRMDDDFGEDRSWPARPYTAGTHPDSPQEQTTEPATPPAPPAAEAIATDGEGTSGQPASPSAPTPASDGGASSPPAGA